MKLVRTIQKLVDGEEVIIAALGDSLTYGWMTEYGFLDFLTTMLNNKFTDSKFKILNRGIPGDTAKDGLRRVDNDVLRFSPDLVFIQFALNDAYTGVSPEDFQRNLESIILKINERSNPEIVLLTSVALLDPVEDRIAQNFYQKICESGEKFQLVVVKVNEYWEKKTASGIKHTLLVQSDGIHPTEKGYEFMAEAVFEIF